MGVAVVPDRHHLRPPHDPPSPNTRPQAKPWLADLLVSGSRRRSASGSRAEGSPPEGDSSDKGDACEQACPATRLPWLPHTGVIGTIPGFKRGLRDPVPAPAPYRAPVPRTDPRPSGPSFLGQPRICSPSLDGVAALDDVSNRTYRQVRFERPPDSCELLLVRHGESADADPAQPFPLVSGRGDPPLSKNGTEQAERLAARLGSTRVDALYVTPLQRTTQTAEPLAQLLGIDPVVEPDLIEVQMGAWEGGRYRERIAASDPLAARVFREERWDVIPGAESNEALFGRTGAAVEAISLRHPGGRVVIVAHAVSIAAILSRATRSSPFTFVGADNGSISVLVVAAERWILRRFNDTAHLE